MNAAKQAFHNTSYRVLVENLTLQACIGILPEERTRAQPLCISLAVTARQAPASVERQSFVCYKELTLEVADLVSRGHIDLLEDLAEMIATLCFARPQAVSVWLRLTKPEAVAHAESVGIETTFERGQNQNKDKDKDKDSHQLRRRR